MSTRTSAAEPGSAPSGPEMTPEIFPSQTCVGLNDLAEGDIHLWRSALGRGAAPERFAEDLDAQDSARLARFSDPGAGRRYAAGRSMLRRVLARYLAISPRSIAFAYGPYGKPHLAGQEPGRGLVFNLSHTRDRLLLAVGYERDLGVDMERWRPLRDMAGFAARCLAEAERRNWQTLPEGKRLPTLFDLWARKEALCKAIGRGIALGLERCVLECRAPHPHVLALPDELPDPPSRWSVRDLPIAPEHSAALAFDRRVRYLRCFDLEGADSPVPAKR